MTVAAGVLSVALATWLVGVQPLLGRRRYRRLIEQLGDQPGARLHHYRSGIAAEWGLAALVAVIAALVHGHLHRLWPVGDDPHAVGSATAAAVALTLSGVALRYAGEGFGRVVASQLRNVAALLPRTRGERHTFAGLAVTAGVCEEVVYRGFGSAAVRAVSPHASKPTIVVVTAAAFGLVHLYQGPRGVLLTGLVGAYLAWLTVSTGNLLPAMVVHAVLDLRILAIRASSLPSAEPSRAPVDEKAGPPGPPSTGGT